MIEWDDSMALKYPVRVSLRGRFHHLWWLPRCTWFYNWTRWLLLTHFQNKHSQWIRRRFKNHFFFSLILHHLNLIHCSRNQRNETIFVPTHCWHDHPVLTTRTTAEHPHNKKIMNQNSLTKPKSQRRHQHLVSLSLGAAGWRILLARIWFRLLSENVCWFVRFWILWWQQRQVWEVLQQWWIV